PRNREGIGRVENRMPVVRQKNPSRKQETMLSATFVDHLGQHGKFLGRKNPPPGKEAAGNKEPSVRNHQPSKARHARNYIPCEIGGRIGIRLPAKCRREEPTALLSALRRNSLAPRTKLRGTRFSKHISSHVPDTFFSQL